MCVGVGVGKANDGDVALSVIRFNPGFNLGLATGFKQIHMLDPPNFSNGQRSCSLPPLSPPCPQLFGGLLVESPSLWIAEERFLREDVAGYRGEWPQRVFVGMGSREYSGRASSPKSPAQDPTQPTNSPALSHRTLPCLAPNAGTTHPTNLSTSPHLTLLQASAPAPRRMPSMMPWWPSMLQTWSPSLRYECLVTSLYPLSCTACQSS